MEASAGRCGGGAVPRASFPALTPLPSPSKEYFSLPILPTCCIKFHYGIRWNAHNDNQLLTLIWYLLYARYYSKCFAFIPLQSPLCRWGTQCHITGKGTSQHPKSGSLTPARVCIQNHYMLLFIRLKTPKSQTTQLQNGNIWEDGLENLFQLDSFFPWNKIHQSHMHIWEWGTYMEDRLWRTAGCMCGFRVGGKRAPARMEELNWRGS